jgi:hypothetical protein
LLSGSPSGSTVAREQGRVSGEPVREHRLSAAGLRRRHFDRNAAVFKHKHRGLQGARRECFGETGREQRDAHTAQRIEILAAYEI